jgi:hypothetical protein
MGARHLLLLASAALLLWPASARAQGYLNFASLASGPGGNVDAPTF